MRWQWAFRATNCDRKVIHDIRLLCETGSGLRHLALVDPLSLLGSSQLKPELCFCAAKQALGGNHVRPVANALYCASVLMWLLLGDFFSVTHLDTLILEVGAACIRSVEIDALRVTYNPQIRYKIAGELSSKMQELIMLSRWTNTSHAAPPLKDRQLQADRQVMHKLSCIMDATNNGMPPKQRLPRAAMVTVMPPVGLLKIYCILTESPNSGYVIPW